MFFLGGSSRIEFIVLSYGFRSERENVKEKRG